MPSHQNQVSVIVPKWQARGGPFLLNYHKINYIFHQSEPNWPWSWPSNKNPIIVAHKLQADRPEHEQKATWVFIRGKLIIGKNSENFPGIGDKCLKDN